MLKDLRLKFQKKFLTYYLKINSLKGKMANVREIMHNISLEQFVVTELKQDKSYPFLYLLWKITK